MDGDDLWSAALGEQAYTAKQPIKKQHIPTNNYSSYDEHHEYGNENRDYFTDRPKMYAGKESYEEGQYDYGDAHIEQSSTKRSTVYPLKNPPSKRPNLGATQQLNLYPNRGVPSYQAPSNSSKPPISNHPNPNLNKTLVRPGGGVRPPMHNKTPGGTNPHPNDRTSNLLARTKDGILKGKSHEERVLWYNTRADSGTDQSTQPAEPEPESAEAAWDDYNRYHYKKPKGNQHAKNFDNNKNRPPLNDKQGSTYDEGDTYYDESVEDIEGISDQYDRREENDWYDGGRKGDGYRGVKGDGYHDEKRDGYGGGRSEGGYVGDRVEGEYRRGRGEDGYKDREEEGYRGGRGEYGYRGRGEDRDWGRGDDGYDGARRDDRYRGREEGGYEARREGGYGGRGRGIYGGRGRGVYGGRGRGGYGGRGRGEYGGRGRGEYGGRGRGEYSGRGRGGYVRGEDRFGSRGRGRNLNNDGRYDKDGRLDGGRHDWQGSFRGRDDEWGHLTREPLNDRESYDRYDDDYSNERSEFVGHRNREDNGNYKWNNTGNYEERRDEEREFPRDGFTEFPSREADGRRSRFDDRTDPMKNNEYTNRNKTYYYIDPADTSEGDGNNEPRYPIKGNRTKDMQYPLKRNQNTYGETSYKEARNDGDTSFDKQERTNWAPDNSQDDEYTGSWEPSNPPEKVHAMNTERNDNTVKQQGIPHPLMSNVIIPPSSRNQEPKKQSKEDIKKMLIDAGNKSVENLRKTRKESSSVSTLPKSSTISANVSLSGTTMMRGPSGNPLIPVSKPPPNAVIRPLGLQGIPISGVRMGTQLQYIPPGCLPIGAANTTPYMFGYRHPLLQNVTIPPVINTLINNTASKSKVQTLPVSSVQSGSTKGITLSEKDSNKIRSFSNKLELLKQKEENERKKAILNDAFKQIDARKPKDEREEKERREQNEREKEQRLEKDSKSFKKLAGMRPWFDVECHTLHKKRVRKLARLKKAKNYKKNLKQIDDLKDEVREINKEWVTLIRKKKANHVDELESKGDVEKLCQLTLTSIIDRITGRQKKKARKERLHRKDDTRSCVKSPEENEESADEHDHEDSADEREKSSDEFEKSLDDHAVSHIDHPNSPNDPRNSPDEHEKSRDEHEKSPDKPTTSSNVIVINDDCDDSEEEQEGMENIEEAKSSNEKSPSVVDSEDTSNDVSIVDGDETEDTSVTTKKDVIEIDIDESNDESS